MDLDNSKDRLFATLLSAFLYPGAGQIYKREFLKGTIIILLFSSLLIFLLIRFIYFFKTIFMNIEISLKGYQMLLRSSFEFFLMPTNITIIVASLLIWIISIIDCYKK
ncbi:MAG: hypothetical protein JRI44_09755 [Deltaproteobacteria bacterium]|nr:hypothetical protein [Deltaproteobacteria bacterium]